MSYKIFSGILESLKLKSTRLPMSITGTHQQVRYRRPTEPKLRIPFWRTQQLIDENDEKLTYDNQMFLQQMAKKNYELSDPYFAKRSPLKEEPLERKEWAPGCSRSGVIGIKLGTIPQWFKNGKKTIVTLIQIVDNHVIKYLPPGTSDRRPYAKKYEKQTRGMGNLVVGAVTGDPQKFTREYCELFSKAGVLPKKILTKFPIHPDARLQVGTPLYAGHFQVGDVVDITGKTISRGFQGVMKRWGFHGMPASHGQTKTHRRPGNIGAGGEKGRVWPGKKMPGHVGNRTRTARCLQIMRINHKLNVLYVFGIVPGDVNSFVYVHDTICKPKKVQKKLKEPREPFFPTYYPEEHPERPAEEFYEKIFNFLEPSITFTPEKTTAKKK